MLYRKIIAVCSEIHTKHINTLCNHWALKGSEFSISNYHFNITACKPRSTYSTACETSVTDEGSLCVISARSYP